MTVAQLADVRRQRTFELIAEALVAHGLAVGDRNDAGVPRVLAAVIPVIRCERCGGDMPSDHEHAAVVE